MEEIWKPIEGYPGYEISNLGRIKSFKINKKEGQITTGVLTVRGYLTKRLFNEAGYKNFYVHRLVAQAFLPNPNNLPEINHKDENKLNNCLDNLEWCDRQYNVRYGTRNERTSQSMLCHPSLSKGVYSIDKNGNKEWYASIGEAERQTGCSHSNIVRTLKGRTKTCGGRKWFYQE